MIISDLAVKNRTTVFALTVIVAVTGTACYLMLPRESAPDVQIPNVFVQTNYRGVSPGDMEKYVTNEIEKKLKGLEGIKKIKSSSQEGLSFINIEFMTGVNIDDALVKVKDKVDLAKPDLPVDLEDDPVVTELSFSEEPILIVALSGPCGPQQLTKLAEDLEDELEAIPGVLAVDLSGNVEREIHVLVDKERLALYGLSQGEVESALTRENQNVSGGSIRTKLNRFLIQVPGELKHVNEIGNIVVAAPDGQPVYLRDVAQIRDSIKDRETYSRIDGQDAVTVMLKKRSGENIIEIVKQADAVLARLQPTWPAGTVVSRITDRSKEIKDMIADLENNIVTGLILVVAVVCLAMGLRNAILVSLSIPLSMLMSFIVLKMLGITLNMVVLFSLTLALGMLVDNAIVITENIYRFMQQGVPRIEATMRATSEVAWPIIGSGLTTIAAFVPLLWWTGIMGGFMVFLPKTVIITLACCLFVAMVINPALAAVFMKVDAGGQQTTADAIQSAGEHPMLTGGGPILATYRWVLNRALRYRLGVVVFAIAVTVGMFQLWLLVVGLEKPQEFFPSIDPLFATVDLKVPEGADLDYGDALVREAAARVGDERAAPAIAAGRTPPPYAECLRPKPGRKESDGSVYQKASFLPNVEFVNEQSGLGGGGATFFGGSANNHVRLQFLRIEDRTESTKLTLGRIEERIKGLVGAEVTVAKSEEGPPSGAAINIEISGKDFAVLGELAEKVKAIVMQTPHVRNVRSDFEQGSPTFEVRVDRQQAALAGLSTQAIGNAIRAAFNGSEISTFRETDDDYDITVRFRESDRRTVDTLSQIMITGGRGLVPLTSVAKVEYTGSLGAITRINYRRVVTVAADVDETKTTGITARLAAQKLLAGFTPPPGYQLTFTGENEFQQESQDFLSWAMGVALMLITFVLVAQFNSVVYPFIIMTTVLLSFAGVFWGMAMYRQPFGIIMTSVGVISLAGVVVNNAIVLVDYTRQLAQRGLAPADAIVAAGATRLRPVLLTAITTILGLIPMITGVSFDFHVLKIQWVSESSQWWCSMAVAVCFGLGLATMLTLVVVPVQLSLAHDLRAAARWLACLPPYYWWRWFDRRHGTDHAAAWRLSYAEARERTPFE